VMWGTRNRVRTRHSQLVAVLGVSVMAEFACWPDGALGDSALSTTTVDQTLWTARQRIRRIQKTYSLHSTFGTAGGFEDTLTCAEGLHCFRTVA
jgi:hypothetical protein